MTYLHVQNTAGIAAIRMNRPEKHNAFDDQLIAELTDAFRKAADDSSARVVVLESTGSSFSAGADLSWMKRMAGQDRQENQRDAQALADLMGAIDRCPKPVLAIVQGAAFGGGVGLGLIPAVISPYVAAAIGPRTCRRYFLTAERFDAATAQRLGLVQEVVPQTELAAARDRMIEHLLKGGPSAQRAAKDLIARVAGAPIDAALMADTARRIAEARASDEGKEGLAAFLEKRKPNWQ